ncbi:DNA replication protein [Fictibacillus sp. Mic-4]|uniref:DNA replication protein n=1 Tax=Fictibacillus sp. Mic-4 TaxID=3132826 RepID=UPI003CF167D4
MKNEPLTELNTLESRCLLATNCAHAGTPSCTRLCPHYNAVMGSTGRGGRAGNANLPADYALLTLKTSPVRTNQTKVYERLSKYVSTFTRQFEASDARIKSVYLWSESPGTGKTTTAACLLNEFLAQYYVGSLKRGETPISRPCYFLDVNEWQTLYNEFNRPRVPEEIAEKASVKYYRSMEYAKYAKYTVLDDVGVREASDGFRGDLHSVINYRVTNGLPTCYTSNLPIKYEGEKDTYDPYDLYDIFGEKRLVDRIRDQCIPLYFEGESKRGIRR